MTFNDEQLAIINEKTGAILVSAPVGTGKTAVLVERVARAIEEGLDPSSVLCLTFTNRAAEEMKSRLKPRLDDPATYNDITITTFHGFCAMFLRQEAARLGLPTDFAIADEVEQLETLSRILAQLPNWQDTNNRDKTSIIDRFYRQHLDELLAELGMKAKPKALPEPWKTLSQEYYHALLEHNALDFNELVIWTLRALYNDQFLIDKWSARFALVQLDEFQDTHLSEYLVVKQLARKFKNLTLVGDLAQTIYTWRGSQPTFVTKLFKTHFSPVVELSLSANYRSAPDLLAAAQSILAPNSIKPTIPTALHIQACADTDTEATTLLSTIKTLRAEEPEARLAVLLRNNAPITRLAEKFSTAGVASLTVDQYNFFRRQEIRDALSWLKLLFNRYDTDSLRRISLRPGKKLSPNLIDTVSRAGGASGLKPADFLDFSSFKNEEPFAELLTAWAPGGRLVVLDTETTGTNTEQDDIIQVFALEIIAGQPAKELHLYLKPTRKVGLSYYVHRLTDEFLAENGQDAKTGLLSLIDFVGDATVIGHNISFDLGILVSNSSRHNLKWRAHKHFDTLDIARRFVKANNYRLSTLSKQLGLSTATHSADDDVAATADLLAKLIPRLSEGASARRDLFKMYSKQFISLATDLARWRLTAKSQRPAETLQQILNESGLREYYQAENNSEKRLASLDTLVKLFTDWDNPAEEAWASLTRLINAGALLKNVDFLGLDSGKVPIVTIHQVKGLEFDYVFMPQLNEGQLPGWRNADVEEERRVFYVALTRAKKGIFISYSLVDAWNRPQAPSRFITPWL